MIVFFPFSFLPKNLSKNLISNCFKAKPHKAIAVASSNHPRIGIMSVGSGMKTYIAEAIAVMIQNILFIVIDFITYKYARFLPSPCFVPI